MTFLQLLIYLWSSFHPSRVKHWYCRKNVVWIFGVLILQHFEKTVTMKTLWNFPKKPIYFGVFNSSTSAGLLGVRKTIRPERLMSVLDVQKKTCLRNFRHVRRGMCMQLHARYDKAIFIPSFYTLNYLYSLFRSDIYALLNEEWQIYEGRIRWALSLLLFLFSPWFFSLRVSAVSVALRSNLMKILVSVKSVKLYSIKFGKKHIHTDRERIKKSWDELMKGTLKIPVTFKWFFNLYNAVQGSKT